MISSDSDLPDLLNSSAKRGKRAKQLAADFLGKKARRVLPAQIQGFFSRTLIVEMQDRTRIVVQFRVSPVETEYFEHAREKLGSVVPSATCIEDVELQEVGFHVYMLDFIPGDIWYRVRDPNQRINVASSLGSILARGFVSADSTKVVNDHIRPILIAIQQSLTADKADLAKHLDKALEELVLLNDLPLWISHFDLNEANVHVENGQVSGILDWEFSSDLPFGVGLHRVVDTIVARNSLGELRLRGEYELSEAAFWDSLWQGLSPDLRKHFDNRLQAIEAAMRVGSIVFHCWDPDNQKPLDIAEKSLKFLLRALSYELPQSRGSRPPFSMGAKH